MSNPTTNTYLRCRPFAQWNVENTILPSITRSSIFSVSLIGTWQGIFWATNAFSILRTFPPTPLTDAAKMKISLGLTPVSNKSRTVATTIFSKLERILLIYWTGSPSRHASSKFRPIIALFTKSPIWLVIRYDICNGQRTNSRDFNNGLSAQIWSLIVRNRASAPLNSYRHWSGSPKMSNCVGCPISRRNLITNL